MNKKKLTKKERQERLIQTIEDNPFITDEALSQQFGVSIQTIRLDRMETGIRELRERIKTVAARSFEEVKTLDLDEVIGEIIDISLDQGGISIFEVKPEHVFARNNIVRGHHLFAQANSLAVAVIDDEVALTHKSAVQFEKQVKLGERVVAKAQVTGHDANKRRTYITIESYVQNERVFQGQFELYRSNRRIEVEQNENNRN
ncbi:MAG: transcription factor FapR [Bacilli bacterium]